MNLAVLGRACVYALATAFAVASPVLHQQSASQAKGIIEVRVVYDATGTPLAGARLVVDGTAIEATTDSAGVYRLTSVASGDRRVVVTYLGRADQFLDI